MSKKRILSIGIDFCSDEITCEKISNKISLLDWDIVIFKPSLETYSDESYNGKPCLSDDLSFHYRGLFEYWKREITEAVKHGKTVIVYLPEYKEVYAATGEKQFSGTGRNQRTTRIVNSCSNYNYLPIDFHPIEGSGTELKLAAKNSECITSYWQTFGAESKYHVTIGVKSIPSCIVTKVGEKPVGTITINEHSSGALLCLPGLAFDKPEYFKRGEDKKYYWTDSAKIFAKKFIREIIEIDNAIKKSGTSSPVPDWVVTGDFSFNPEKDLHSKMLDAERKISVAVAEKNAITTKIEEWSSYRGLLFETGKPLEKAIIKSLIILGFEAEPFQNSESEFDVVFSCPEGRFIGEAEGRDTKPINIDKLRQLSMNIDEDLRREEVSIPAKPVLFGNGYRLLPLSERPSIFTEKCISAAIPSNTALVSTPELFRVVKLLINTPNSEFSKQCRLAILNGKGMTNLPTPSGKTPKLKKTDRVSDSK